MKYGEALDIAKAEARKVTGGIPDCATPKTRLIVLVFGDNNDVLPRVRVTVDARPPVDTDENGIAIFDPIIATDHTVHVDRPESSPDLIAPDDETENVKTGTCPIVPMHMPTGVIPEITVVWAHDDSAVENVEIELLKSGAPKCTTLDTGVAAWTQRVRPYSYDIKGVFADGVKYLFDKNSVDLLQGPRHTLKIRRYIVKFHIRRQTGAALEELVGARVKLQEPEREIATALKAEQALAEFVIPVVSRQQRPTCKVVSLTPDGTDAVYQVVDVTSV